MNNRRIARWLIVALVSVMSLTIGYKLIILKYDINKLIPAKSYLVSINLMYTGHGDDLLIQTYLPESEGQQIITEEQTTATALGFMSSTSGISRTGEWRGYAVDGPGEISYSFRAQLQALEYTIDPRVLIPDAYPPEIQTYLSETETIQTNHQEIRDLAAELADQNRHLEKTLANIYGYVSRLGDKPFKGTTDALTTLRLGAASCNGKSRLLTALARQSGIPARLVGGLILNNGTKRTTHQWVEVYADGFWIPVDALNEHYLSLPDNYLALYRGDKVMFRYSANIGFDYRYDIKKQIVPNAEMEQYLGIWNLNLYSFLHTFQRVNISLNLLKLILMIPVGVIVVVISRNIVGLNTFGTFLPALMAVAVRETGLASGIIAFIFTLTLVSLIRWPLQKMGILHTPKLAIMMIGVVVSLFGLTILSNYTELAVLSRLGAASLFPVAILTITSERFAITLEEEGLWETLKILAQTMGVMSLCYLLMNSLALQTLILAFPEIILGVAALNLWMGSWIGIRVRELFRFKQLLMPVQEDLHG